jgi:DNA-binding transcriptional LysR family regulator
MGHRPLDWNRHISRHLKLRELHILATVVDRGSMAKAAGDLAMTQSAVSEAIANFEATLGVQLLDRSPRGVEPTIYARVLLDRGRVVFNELRRGLRDIEFLSDPTAGEVRVGAPESLSAGLVPAIIERLSATHPRIHIHVVQANTASLEFHGLLERNLDLMIGRIPRDFAEEDLKFDILFQDDNYIVSGAASRWARRRKIELKELVNEPWILPSSSNLMSALIEQTFRAKGLAVPRNSVTSNSIHLRMQLLATGRFLSLLPESVLRYNAGRGPLKALPVDLKIDARPVAIVTLKNRTLSPVAQLFIDSAREICGQFAQR